MEHLDCAFVFRQQQAQAELLAEMERIKSANQIAAQQAAVGQQGNNNQLLGAGLTAGGTIKLTQSAVVLEKLISQFMYNKAAEGGSSK